MFVVVCIAMVKQSFIDNRRHRLQSNHQRDYQYKTAFNHENRP
ncbi:hypothetical protein BN2364_0674 [Alloalcanivorax xenomutans]|nr:hypothetical protein BN2364_0674 [Alloalcanivorax xenomutans]